jgi:hypothetical protein
VAVKYEEHLKHILALLVLFVVLTGSVVLLFIADENQMQTGQSSPYITSVVHKSIYGTSESSLSSSLLPLTASGHSQSEIAVLDNDQDHDGNYDGMADPLAALGSAFLVAFCMPFILGPSVGSRLLLVFCEPPILVSSDYYLALEQPD